MAGTPLLFQLHTLAALALVAVWPFTRLVHTWAVPITVFRPPARPADRRSPAAGSFPVR